MIQQMINLETLSEYFHLPITEVARKIGVCATVLKKICRKNGIPRWPHRKIKSLDKMISTLESMHMKSPAQRERIEKEIAVLRSNKDYLMKNPSVITQNSNLKRKRYSDPLKQTSSFDLNEPGSPDKSYSYDQDQSQNSVVLDKSTSEHNASFKSGVEPLYLNLSNIPLSASNDRYGIYRVSRISGLKRAKVRERSNSFCEQQQKAKRLKVTDKSKAAGPDITASTLYQAHSYPFNGFTFPLPCQNVYNSDMTPSEAQQQLLVGFPRHMNYLLQPAYISNYSINNSSVSTQYMSLHMLPIDESLSENEFLISSFPNKNLSQDAFYSSSVEACSSNSSSPSESLPDSKETPIDQPASSAVADEGTMSLMQLAMAVESDLETLSPCDKNSEERSENKCSLSSIEESSVSEGYIPKVTVIPGVDTILISSDYFKQSSCALSRPPCSLSVSKIQDPALVA
ncbi:uncharacterized protein LOC126325822 [Schistocerca gregaria]|uniref:uncharacterized protein LOC126325822 n=1 Tax=Schistocerca gregaria TaxID=7010 RepID=UPI00211DFE6C|nr:uncharacterized protein LOC126325822 [Schistocerca gregaria]XP_049851264.1 uncharacterized protein LOC126325822 [Schistocerca gregaria]